MDYISNYHDTIYLTGKIYKIKRKPIRIMIKQIAARIVLIALFIGGVNLMFNIPLRAGIQNNIPLKYVIASSMLKIAFIEVDRKNGIVATGSGFVYDGTEGYILTAAHVVRGAIKIKVSMVNGKTLDADIIGINRGADVAVLKVNSTIILPQVIMTDSRKVEVGDKIFTIGKPLGFVGYTSIGTIATRVRGYIMADIDINPGNSGGAVFSTDGRVIGMAVAVYLENEHSTGITFITPSNIVSKAAYRIIRKSTEVNE